MTHFATPTSSQGLVSSVRVRCSSGVRLETFVLETAVCCCVAIHVPPLPNTSVQHAIYSQFIVRSINNRTDGNNFNVVQEIGYRLLNLAPAAEADMTYHRSKPFAFSMRCDV